MDCKQQTNEEVIEELTKDLEKSCVKEEDASKDEKCFDASDKAKEDTEESENNTDTVDKEKEDTEESEDSTDTFNDAYFVDEVLLKDRNVDYTEEQKEKYKHEAENFKKKGNDYFREEDFVSATQVYTNALWTCPLIFEKDRAILYANRAAARAKFEEDNTKAIEDCTKAIELEPNYVKAYLRRAHLYEEADKLDEALADYKKVLTFDPAHTESICAIKRLEPMINERNEELKEEMLGKLKDLGNMILKPFGLSTSNFQMQKDEATGGYSVKMV